MKKKKILTLVTSANDWRYEKDWGAKISSGIYETCFLIWHQ